MYGVIRKSAEKWQEAQYQSIFIQDEEKNLCKS